jgi:competence ComEA-like helix-hairpin-helix protein
MDEEMSKIDVNRAGVEELAQIPGIAESLARRIIEYRETVHPFEEVIELAAVPGISERMVREFADRVTVEPIAAMERNAALSAVTLQPRTGPTLPETDTEAEIFEFVTDPIEEESEEAADEVIEAVEANVKEIIEEVEIEEPAPRSDEADTAKLPPLVEPIRVEPEPTFQTRPTPQIVQGPSQGRVLVQILLGSILGAFVGVIMTLAILAALNNGTLSFAQADTRLQGEIQNAQSAHNDLQQTVDTLNSDLNDNLSHIATRTGDLFLQQEETDSSLQDMTTTMRQTQVDVNGLEEVTQALDERLTTVAAAAETFDAFLDGLRGLLIDLDGEAGTAVPGSATPVSTIAVTPTPIGGTGSAATAVASPTTPPTRTPHPTATPLPLPTSTPGQQP